MTDFGTAIGCMDDADPRWSTVTGEALVLQDVYHRVTTDSVLGRIINSDGTIDPDPRAENFGDDLRKYVGSAQTDDSLAALGVHYSAVVQRSERVDAADCKVEIEDAWNGNVNLLMRVSGTSASGPFSFVFRADSTTVKLLSGGAEQ